MHQELLGSYSDSCSDGLSGKIREEADDDNYLESIKKAEPEVEDGQLHRREA
jgi:hypothetical protein